MAVCKITDYGAKGDGVTGDTAAIRKAIEACAGAGGGMVVVPAGGTFLTGSFDMESNVELHVERGARLIGSTRQEDYPHHVFDSGPEANKRVWIRAIEADNIAITGGGVIDGGAPAFATGELPYIYRTVDWRPAMTCFIGCRNIRVRDITLKDSANWALHFSGCEDVVVHGVTIRNNLKFPNCDGIDPDHCRNVRISDCHIEAGDDCIVLKNTRPFARYGPTENVTVTGCTLVSTSAAIKIGSESMDDFRNIVFDSCVISASHRGLGIQLRDEGNVENVIFSNMTVETRHFEGSWWGAAEPIYVTAFHRGAGSRLGKVRNILFSNILCRGENGLYLSGCEDSLLDEIVLDRVRVEVDRWSRWDGGFYDRRPCDIEGIVRGRTAGIYCANAGRIAVRDCSVAWGGNVQEYFGSALEASTVGDLALDRFRGRAAHPDRDGAVVRPDR